MNFQILSFLRVFFHLYSFCIFLRVVFSWINPSPNSLTYFISDITDPYLNLFKKIIPPLGMIDISPIVALYALNILESILVALLV